MSLAFWIDAVAIFFYLGVIGAGAIVFGIAFLEDRSRG